MPGRAIARTALLCNAAFSLVSGLALAIEGSAALVAGSSPQADLMARALGFGLIAFAPLVAWIALRRLSVGWVLALTASDVAWVLTSLAGLGLAADALTAAGMAAVAGVAAAVLLFASGQALGAVRMSAA